MNFKEPFLSNCEKTFIQKAITSGVRHDGRNQHDFRDLSITFGVDYGSVHVCLGETRVLAQVTCSVQQPKGVRPQEGMLCVYLELGPMAAPHFEVGRQSNLAILTSRALEKCLKDSNILNLESLCLRAGAKVWEIRVDLNVLNFDGSLVDAASIAATTALAHFRRPDVTLTGSDITIHSFEDKEPIPLIIQHYPVYVTYAFFDKGERIIADPTALEERIAEGQISLAVNAYKELCGLHLEGSNSVTSDLVLRCAERAAKRARKLVEIIKKHIEEDKQNRSSNTVIGYNECLRLNKIPSYSENSISFKLRNYKRYLAEKVQPKKEPEIVEEPEIRKVAPNTAELCREKSDEEMVEDKEVMKPKRKKMKIKKVENDSESEEDETMILNSNE